jgi:hypothetical protein
MNSKKPQPKTKGVVSLDVPLRTARRQVGPRHLFPDARRHITFDAQLQAGLCPRRFRQPSVSNKEVMPALLDSEPGRC